MKRYYLIDHRHLFLFGFIFYLLTPYLIGKYHLFTGYPGIALYQGFFNLVPAEKLSSYILITLLWLPAFFLGHFSFQLIHPFKRPLRLFPATQVTAAVSYVGVGLFIVLIIFTYLSRGSIFGGYASYDIGARGKMSTLLVIFNFFLLYQLVSKQRLSLILLAGTLLTAFLLLSMGGRM